MADLSLQRTKVFMIVDVPFGSTFDDFERSLNMSLCDWAYCYHDKDTYEEDCILYGVQRFKGQPKVKHIHLYLGFNNKHQLKFYIRMIADFLNVKHEQISITPCDNTAGAIQYLIHKNNPEKFQYNQLEIRSNFSAGLLDELLKQETKKELSTDDIINIIYECKGRDIELIKRLGIHRYNLYRRTIIDIQKELSNIQYRK